MSMRIEIVCDGCGHEMRCSEFGPDLERTHELVEDWERCQTTVMYRRAQERDLCMVCATKADV